MSPQPYKYKKKQKNKYEMNLLQIQITHTRAPLRTTAGKDIEMRTNTKWSFIT